MEIDAEMRRKIVASVAVVLLFVVALLGIGTSYDIPTSATGGYALVGVMAAFIAAMGALGFYLSRASED